jgi:hypothetical protein
VSWAWAAVGPRAAPEAEEEAAEEEDEGVYNYNDDDDDDKETLSRPTTTTTTTAVTTTAATTSSSHDDMEAALVRGAKMADAAELARSNSRESDLDDTDEERPLKKPRKSLTDVERLKDVQFKLDNRVNVDGVAPFVVLKNLEEQLGIVVKGGGISERIDRVEECYWGHT